MIAPPDRTSPRLDTELAGEVFSFLEHAPPPLPAPPSAPPADAAVDRAFGPLTRRVIDIFTATVNGSPSAPVFHARERALAPALDTAFRRATTPRINHHHSIHSATKGTA